MKIFFLIDREPGYVHTLWLDSFFDDLKANNIKYELLNSYFQKDLEDKEHYITQNLLQNRDASGQNIIISFLFDDELPNGFFCRVSDLGFCTSIYLIDPLTTRHRVKRIINEVDIVLVSMLDAIKFYGEKAKYLPYSINGNKLSKTNSKEKIYDCSFVGSNYETRSYFVYKAQSLCSNFFLSGGGWQDSVKVYQLDGYIYKSFNALSRVITYPIKTFSRILNIYGKIVSQFIPYRKQHFNAEYYEGDINDIYVQSKTSLSICPWSKTWASGNPINHIRMRDLEILQCNCLLLTESNSDITYLEELGIKIFCYELETFDQVLKEAISISSEKLENILENNQQILLEKMTWSYNIKRIFS